MSVYQGNDFKKISGGKKRPGRDKRKYELGSYPTETKLLHKDVREVDRTYGGNVKIRLKYASHANVLDPESKTCKKVRILGVVDVPANKDYAKRGIIVKGAIIQTEIGKAVVTSRPGQDGVVNAILIKG
uniref:Small ribosomal subunit protein eS8 n=1 Tax=Ignisphaera aggregans TaxID=334771 RepID=A0A7C2VFX9_9CREN